MNQEKNTPTTTDNKSEVLLWLNKNRLVLLIATIAVGSVIIGNQLISKNTNPEEDNTQNDKDAMEQTEQVEQIGQAEQPVQSPGEKIETKNQYGYAIEINNYDELLPDLPSDRRDAINNHLYNIVGNNLDIGTVPDITDAEIVKKTVTKEYNEDDNMHYGKFDVSIKSINQYYSVTYSWTLTQQNPNITKYGNGIDCTKKSHDGCIDSHNNDPTNPNNKNRGSIADFLPYDTLHYVVVAKSDKTLVANINLSLADTRNGMKEQSVEKYKNQIEEWFKTTGLDRSDYKIEYKIND